MPQPTSSAAKGYTMVGPELGNSDGLYQLLTDTAVSALPVSLTAAIPAAATNGMRLVIFAYQHTATGTVTATGTAPLSLAAVNETTTTIPLAEWQGDMVAYCTSTVFGAINASGITLGGGLTSGRIQIFGIQAATRLVPGDFKLHDKYLEYSPLEQRGIYETDFHLLPLQTAPEWEWQGDFYPDTCMFLYEGGYNATLPGTTYPASPTALHASASVTSSGNESATSQPTAPGMILQCVIGGAPASAGTVTVTGTNVYGETYSEVVVPSSQTAGTYYSIGIFATIAASGIVWTAFGGTGTLTVNGIFGFNQGTTAGDTLQSFAIEQYDSTGSWAASFALVDEWALEFGMSKEFKVAAKGPCQYIAQVGSTSTTTTQITALVQNQDRPITGWRAVAWIDSISGTAGTTAQSDVVDGKIAIKLNWVPKYTSWGNPVPVRTWGRAYRKRREISGEVVLDMTTTTLNAEFLAFKQRRKRQLRLQMLGLPSIDASNHYLGFTLDLPVRWIDVAERVWDPSKESVEVALKFKGEYDIALGYSHKFTNWITHFSAF